jgi:signal peptidase I
VETIVETPANVDTRPVSVPLERTLRKSDRPSIFHTVRSVLLRPRNWFSNLPSEGVGTAIVIAMLVRLVADPIAALGMRFVDPVPTAMIAVSGVTAPLSVLISVYLQASIVWGIARLLGNERARFSTVVRLMAYAQIAGLFGVVPVLGPFVAVLWNLCLCAIGIRCVLGVSWAAASGLVLAGPVLEIVFAVTLRTVALEAFKMPSQSMAPTLPANDHFFVNKLAYGLTEHRVPSRGDVIVFPFPERPDQIFSKRVIGLPGDEILLKGGEVHINAWKIPRCEAGPASLGEASEPGRPHEGDLFVEFVDEAAYLVFHDRSRFPVGPDDVQGPYRVAPGEVFVLGDNREASHDSRGWFEGAGGGVPMPSIKGRASIIWLSFKPQGIAWSRIGRSVAAPPSCFEEFARETCTGIERCLANRPPRSATTPPPLVR